MKRLCTKSSLDLIRLSGRLKIGQRFIAGIGGSPIRSPRSGRLERLRIWRDHSVVRFTDYKIRYLFIPAVNCWAIIIRPLCGLIKVGFVSGANED